MTGSRRDLPSRAVRWLRGAGTVVATVVLAGVLVVALVVGRSSPPGPSGGSDPTPASTSAAVVPPPSSAPSAAPEPTPAPVGASPTAVAVLDPSPSPDAATPRPTASPNPRPTAEPTPRPTADPTPRPKPTPLPTPVVHRYTAHGSFGDTLTVKGIAIRVVPAEPDLAQATICRTDDPERQGWTEVLTYEITATWPDPSDADDPMFEVGAHPWFVTLYDPPVTSGVPSRVTTCHRPGDSMVVHVGLSGGQDANEILIEYEWYFG